MSQKTILCERVERVNFTKVKSIVDNVVTFSTPSYNFEVLPEANNMIFTETGDDTPAGNLITQKLTGSILSNADYFNEISTVPQIFRLFLSDGSNRIWGTPAQPVRIDTFKRDTNAGSVAFVRKITNFEL